MKKLLLTALIAPVLISCRGGQADSECVAKTLFEKVKASAFLALAEVTDEAPANKPLAQNVIVLVGGHQSYLMP